MPKETYLFIPYEKNTSGDVDRSEHLRKDVAGALRSSADIASAYGYAEHKVPKKIICYQPRVQSLTFLNNLNPEDYRLDVLGHGKFENLSINNERSSMGGYSELISADELARRLIQSGLPHNIKHLNLYMCNSGKMNEEGKSIAGEVFKNLSTQDFNQVQVKGYTEPLINQVKRVDTEYHKQYYNPQTKKEGRPSEVSVLFKNELEQVKKKDLTEEEVKPSLKS